MVIFVTPTPVGNHILASQGLPQLLRLKRYYGWQVTVISFESAMKTDRSGEIYKSLDSLGIKWVPIYHPRVPSVLRFLPVSLFTAFKALFAVRTIVLKHRGGILLQCRSYAGAFLAYTARLICFIRAPWVFDVRGIYPDELVREGAWCRDSIKFKLAKLFERLALRDAQHVFVVNECQSEALKETDVSVTAKLSIIAHSVNTDRFAAYRSNRARVRRYLAVKDEPVVSWLAGAIRPIHMPGKVGQFFVQFRRLFPRAVLLVITKDNPSLVLSLLGITALQTRFVSASSEYVPALLSASDLAMGLIHPSHEDIGIKFSEYIASGLPIVANDSRCKSQTDLIKKKRIGVVLNQHCELRASTDFRDISSLLLSKDVSTRCFTTAARYFSIHSQVEKYDSVFNSVIGV